MSIAPNGQPLCVKNRVRADPTQLYRMYGKSNISHLSASRPTAAFLHIDWPASGLRTAAPGRRGGAAAPPGQAQGTTRAGAAALPGRAQPHYQGGRSRTTRAGAAAPPGRGRSDTPGAGAQRHRQGHRQGRRSGTAGETLRPCAAWPSIAGGPPRAILFEFPINTRWQGKGRAFAGQCGHHSRPFHAIAGRGPRSCGLARASTMSELTEAADDRPGFIRFAERAGRRAPRPARGPADGAVGARRRRRRGPWRRSPTSHAETR
jgi:hypothetical protein